MNFDSGTKLAIFQEILFNKYLTGATITNEEQVRLYSNMYVPMAARLAPNNLVVRHYALRQLILHEDFTGKIVELIKKIAYEKNGEVGLWAAGYSYWEYTKGIFQRLNNPVIDHLSSQVDLNFQRTAYVKANGLLYPAPFGDTWPGPLDNYLQDLTKVNLNADIMPVKKLTFPRSITPPYWRWILTENDCPTAGDITAYAITGAPIGLNNHIQLNNSKHYINIIGEPHGFKFYNGYPNKYSSAWQEWMDILAWKRIKSLW